MAKNALVVLQQGFEEIEAITPIDILRRGDVHVTTASCSESLNVEGKSGITVKADVLLKDVIDNTHDGLILLGGPGIEKALQNESLIELIRTQYTANSWIGAICAAPLLLDKTGILEKHRFTAHASVHDRFSGRTLNQRVVVDHPLITSPGPGTATAFAFALLTALESPQKARDVAVSIHWYAKQDWQTKAITPDTRAPFEHTHIPSP